MKYKTTKKAIKEAYTHVYSLGYCRLQTTLKVLEPFAYSTRAEGWACDYYEITPDICISTGYNPTGKAFPLDYEVTEEYEKAAAKIWCDNSDYKTLREKALYLIAKLANDIESATTVKLTAKTAAELIEEANKAIKAETRTA